MSIGAEKYVAFTTYKKDGTAKTLPVWISDLDDGRVGFTTPSSSWKVKRLSNDDRVRLQPSDGRGNPREGAEAVEGTAVVVAGDEFEAVKTSIKAKYGYQFTLAMLVGKISGLFTRTQRTSDRAVVVTLST